MLKAAEYKAKIAELYAAMNAEDEKNDSIENNDEWEKANAATVEKFMPKIQALEKALEYIQISAQPHNEWFASFCESFISGQHLTEKQFAVFAKYAKCTQSCRYKTPVNIYRVIVNGKYYAISNSHKTVEITQIETI